MNLTIYALSVSFFYSSPLISPSSFSIFSKQSFQQVHMNHFFTHFFLDHSSLESMSFSHSSFINFLKTPFSIEKYNKYQMINKSRINKNMRIKTYLMLLDALSIILMVVQIGVATLEVVQLNI